MRFAPEESNSLNDPIVGANFPQGDTAVDGSEIRLYITTWDGAKTPRK